MARFASLKPWHHKLSSGIPLWPGDPAVQTPVVATIKKDGYFLRSLTIGEHSGTHLNAPCSFLEDGMDVSALIAKHKVNHTVFGVAVVPVNANSAAKASQWYGEPTDGRRETIPESPSMQLQVSDILAFEEKQGRQIAAGSLVFCFSDWSSRWDGGTSAFLDRPYAGFAADTVQFLHEERDIVGIGIDTHGVDGCDSEYGANMYCARHNLLAFECVRLDASDVGFCQVVVGALDIEGGSGTLCTISRLVEAS